MWWRRNSVAIRSAASPSASTSGRRGAPTGKPNWFRAYFTGAGGLAARIRGCMSGSKGVGKGGGGGRGLGGAASQAVVDHLVQLRAGEVGDDGYDAVAAQGENR